MLENDDATQGAPQGDTAPQPADQTTAPGTDQNPTDEGQQQTSAEPKGEGEGEKPKQTPWFTRRIDELTFHRREAERENERLRAEIERMRQPPPADGQQGDQQRQQPTRADYERHVQAEARRLTQQADFNRNCDAIFDQGTKAFPDFEVSLGNFRLLGGLPPALVEAAIETGEGHKVLYELGRNPDEAARILSLTPTRMAVAVAKIAGRPPTPPPVSKAPPPIKGVNSASKVETDPDRMNATEWKAWREKQLDKR